MNINKRLLLYVKAMRIYVVLVGLFALITALCIIFQNSYIAQIINKAFLAHQSLPQLLPALYILLGIILVRAIVIWGNELATNIVSTRVKTDLRQRLFAHLFKLGPQFLKGEQSGEIVNTTADGVEALDAYFIQYFPQVCATVIIPTVILIYVFSIDTLSGIVLLITWPVLPFFMILIGKQANAMTEQRWRLLSQLSSHFLDVLQGLTTLKLFGRNHIQEETIRTISTRYGDTTMKVLRVAFLSSLVMEMGATISNAIIAVEIGLRLLYGDIPFEQAFFILLLTPEFYLPLRSLGAQFHASIESAASAERIFDLLETPTSEVANDQNIQVPQTVQEAIEFCDVHYTYTDAGEKQRAEALRGISFKLAPGQKVAIVGASGAGKSTIAHLLLRFLEPTAGAITIDSQPIQSIPAPAWRKLVTWQPQQPYVFNTTVAENIRMGQSDASIDEVIIAAQQANIHDVITQLPQGYETEIGERGALLSGGQVQRLSLARAFLKNAPILVLDEATSTLDTESEQQVLQALERLTPDRIALTIAHRLHTIISADHILVIQDGRIVDQGTHQTLLMKSPVYQELVKAYEEEAIA
ncbi:MAG TPA: thiol reductant ABC exporter subunit CydD [Dictyobacter sp.]|jgi:ATP-binding cassette subfamily C protein CydD|nr:thiol reductant ABC exporter subunit CydD [Dictyobacter sp.]